MSAFIASTYTYVWKADIAVAIDGIAEAGFGGVELLAAPPHVDAGDWQDAAGRIEAACGRTGVRVCSVVPSGLDVNLASPDSSMREWSFGYFGTVGRLAATVGASWLIVHPGRRHPLRPAPQAFYRQWVVDGVRRVLETLSGTQVGVLVENTPTGLFDSAQECAQVIAEVAVEVDPSTVGICYDVANAHMVEAVEEGLSAAASHLALVHLSDTTRASWRHDPIGAGEVDFRQVGSRLASVGYRGDIVLETLHDGDPVAGFGADLAALVDAGWSNQQ